MGGRLDRRDLAARGRDDRARGEGIHLDGAEAAPTRSKFTLAVDQLRHDFNGTIRRKS